MKTVIIDDDMFFTEVLSQKLKFFGFKIIQKIESFEELKNQKVYPDVFFVDYHLKDSNCNRLINFIESKYKKATIVIMSSNDNAYKLLDSDIPHHFIQKSKIRHLKYKIQKIKKNISKGKKRAFNAKSIHFMLILSALYTLLSFLIDG